METHRDSPRPGAAGHPVTVDRSVWAVVLFLDPKCEAWTGSAGDFLGTGYEFGEVDA